MAGTDPITDTITVDPTKERRLAIQRLRSLLFVDPRNVHLFTRKVSQRWLTDRYVIVKLDDEDPVLVMDPDLKPEYQEHYPDGGYWLRAGDGLQAKEFLLSDSQGLLDNLEARKGQWRCLLRTGWSMADSEAKLMLCYAMKEDMERGFPHTEFTPYAMNEGIWNAFLNAYEDKSLSFEVLDEQTPFRVVHEYHGVVGYIAQGRIPERYREEAQQIVETISGR